MPFAYNMTTPVTLLPNGASVAEIPKIHEAGRSNNQRMAYAMTATASGFSAASKLARARPRSFAEILPRFISKPISNNAHKRIFSDRDPLFHWLLA